MLDTTLPLENVLFMRIAQSESGSEAVVQDFLRERISIISFSNDIGVYDGMDE